MRSPRAGHHVLDHRCRSSGRGAGRGRHFATSLRSHTCHTHVAVMLGARERASDGELFVAKPSSLTYFTSVQRPWSPAGALQRVKTSQHLEQEHLCWSPTWPRSPLRSRPSQALPSLRCNFSSAKNSSGSVSSESVKIMIYKEPRSCSTSTVPCRIQGGSSRLSE